MPEETKTVAQQLAEATAALSTLTSKSEADAKASADLLAKAAIDVETATKALADVTAARDAEKARADKAAGDLSSVQEALDKATKALAHPSFKAVAGAAKAAGELPQIGGEPRDAEPQAGDKPHTQKLMRLQQSNALEAFKYSKSHAAELAAENTL